MNREYTTYYESGIGIIKIEGTERGVSHVGFVDEGEVLSDDEQLPDCLKECVEQLDEYFRGDRRTFSLKLNAEGTDFQRRVWRQLQKVPYGETVSYQDIAEAIGNTKAVRAVGGANHNNPVSIVIPCHRVIGKNGRLTGYGGGLWRKKWLLEHERNHLAKNVFCRKNIDETSR